MRYRIALALALLWLLALLSLAAHPHPVHAFAPVSEQRMGAMGEKQPACRDVERLAFIVQAESFSQPDAAHVAIAQIVLREAASRGMSVCALSERTGFVSVYRYALAYPDSWTARQLAYPERWALSLAGDVLAGRLDDATQGAGHWDGQDHPGVLTLWRSGQVRFFR